MPFWTVDADVIVPSKLLLKEQFAARTIRPRIHALLPQFLVPQNNLESSRALDFSTASAFAFAPRRLNSRIGNWILQSVRLPAGTVEASRPRAPSSEFVDHRLADYPEARNHPEEDGTSRLSPYLHFGHIGPLTVALRGASSAARPYARRKRFSSR